MDRRLAWQSDDDVRKASMTGFQAHIARPVNLRGLTVAIARLAVR